MNISSLIKKHNLLSPFFLYDERNIEEGFLDLNSSLPDNFEVFYSVKTNPNIHILKIFKKLGLGAEITSGGELRSVLKASFLPSEIIFTGCGKTKEELESALKKRVYLIIVESQEEIKKINEIALKLKIKQDILLRINPSFSSSSMFLTAGGSQKFGIDEEKIPGIINWVKNLKGINISGLHMFAGSNIFDDRIILRNTEYLFKIASLLEKRFKVNFPVLDIGGGLPIHYSSESKFNVKKLARGLKRLAIKYNFNHRKIIIESGRFLIGNAGDYIAKVVDKKISRGETFVIIDGGIHHFSRANLSKDNLVTEVLNIKKTNNKKKQIVNLVGNLSTPADFMYKISLPNINVGNFLIIKNTGAYGLTAGIVLFSGHSIPEEYIYSKNRKLKNISIKINHAKK